MASQVGVKSCISWPTWCFVIPVIRKEVKRNSNLIELLLRQFVPKGPRNFGEKRIQNLSLVIHDESREHRADNFLALVPAHKIRIPAGHNNAEAAL